MRPKLLNDLEKISAIVCEYKKDPRPTIAGLCRRLEVCPDTLYSKMKDEDEIADKLMEAYTHLVETHEARLHDKSCVGSIFYLKTLKRFGYEFKENSVVDNSVKDHNITITIVPDAYESK
jgi:hypothetical protein